MGPGVIVGVEEFSEPGPIVVGPHAATTLTGERISPISALPGADARIPYGPRSTYIPSETDLEVIAIDDIDLGVV